MTDRGRRFFLKVPPGYFEMSQDQQKVAAVAMWRGVMVQMGEDPDKLMTERVAQDECSDDG
jgi:hypothetical protein